MNLFYEKAILTLFDSDGIFPANIELDNVCE